MNRSLSLHPASLVVGLTLGIACLLLMGQATSSSPVSVEYMPHPRDMIQIAQGSPYTVAPGKILVLTALGTTGGSFSTMLYTDTITVAVNGQPEVVSPLWMNGAGTLSVCSLPNGRSCGAGSVVSVSSTSQGNPAIAWGYLTDAGTMLPGADKAIRVTYRPHPRDMVQIVQGSSYVVPGGSLFVLTALGGIGLGSVYSQYPPQHALLVNGQQRVLSLGNNQSYFILNPLASVPEGLTIPAGSSIDVVQTGGDPVPGRAWGYLAPQ